MNLTKLAKRAEKWSREYRPRQRRSDDAQYAHLHCEVSEAWRDCTDNNFGLRMVPGDGHDKPKGELAELADVIIMVAVIAGKRGYDLEAAVDIKFAELDKRLEIKQAERALR